MDAQFQRMTQCFQQQMFDMIAESDHTKSQSILHQQQPRVTESIELKTLNLDVEKLKSQLMEVQKS